MSRIKELRMQLTPEAIKGILSRFGILPYDENETEIIFPTVCHNLTGGSPKLYYYLNEKIFKCYTSCNAMFDIFDLIIKMKKLRGETFNLNQAIEFTGLENERDYNPEAYKELEYLRKLNSEGKLDLNKELEFQILDISILDRYKYNEDGVRSWINEGISQEAMKKFRIGYDIIQNAITIPNFDYSGKLVGVRGRFLDPNALAKYMPMKYGNNILSHPTGKLLYGMYENRDTIKSKRMAIIFEGEKSVLKMETFYPNNNIGLATTGKKITLDHLNTLVSMGINEIVLAYDKDYTTKTERLAKIEQYEKIIEILKPYFQVSIIVDDENRLRLKDSPVDRGRETFEYLMRTRVKR